MSSRALAKWQTERGVRLDRLEIAHAAVGGRLLADGLNRALVLQLAAEFQGFARELHDEAARALVAGLAPDDPHRQRRLLVQYEQSRRLDRGNAGPSALQDDFRLFGLPLWDGLRRRYPHRARQWQDRLALLNEARNGLAHADGQKLLKVADAGWDITRRSVRRWRSTLDGLAAGIDGVVRDYMRRHLGVEPW